MIPHRSAATSLGRYSEHHHVLVSGSCWWTRCMSCVHYFNSTHSMHGVIASLHCIPEESQNDDWNCVLIFLVRVVLRGAAQRRRTGSAPWPVRIKSRFRPQRPPPMSEGVRSTHPVGYSGSQSTVYETNCNKKKSHQLKKFMSSFPIPFRHVPPRCA